MTTYRLNLNLPEEIKATLEDIKTTTGMSSTDQIKRGIKLLSYVLDAQKRGAEFQVHERDGGYRRIDIIL